MHLTFHKHAGPQLEALFSSNTEKILGLYRERREPTLQLFILPPLQPPLPKHRLRPYQNWKRLFIRAFVALTSAKNPFSDVGAKRGSPQACPYTRRGTLCPLEAQLPSHPPHWPLATVARTPSLHPQLRRGPTAAKAALAAQLGRQWQPVPKSPVAMALQRALQTVRTGCTRHRRNRKLGNGFQSASGG